MSESLCAIKQAPPEVSAQWLRRAKAIITSRQRDIDDKAYGIPAEKRTQYSAEDAHEDFDVLLCEIANRCGQSEVVSLFKSIRRL